MAIDYSAEADPSLRAVLLKLIHDDRLELNWQTVAELFHASFGGSSTQQSGFLNTS